MNKNTKKEALRLKREVLRKLTNLDLTTVAGGTQPADRPETCGKGTLSQCDISGI